jgi:hypothetical protein
MEPVALLDRARGAGLVVLRDGDRLVVRGPKRLGDLAAHLLDRKAEVMAALDAEADPGVAMALAVFPGATVVNHAEAAVWPPPGAWLSSPARPIDIFVTEMPTAQCRCCGARAWHRAGDGWTCSACHPPPSAGQTAVANAGLDTALFGLAERARFPRLALGPGVTVLAGQDGWRRFATLTTRPSLRASALTALLGRQSDDLAREYRLREAAHACAQKKGGPQQIETA